MPIAPKEFLDRVKKCEAKVDALHSTIEELVRERVRAVAAECPGVPEPVLHGHLQARTAGCCCDAIKRIASGKDGL